MNKRIDKTMSQQAGWYALLSVLSFASNLVILIAIHELLGVGSFAAVPMAMIAVTLLNFCTLRLLIFRSSEKSWMTLLMHFIGSIAAFRVGEYLAFLFIHGVAGVHYTIAYAVVLALSAVGKFLFLRGVVFAPARPMHVLHEAKV